jgi:hypothetical protein
MNINLAGAVFLVLLILKLCHVITISWWWVTCPLWIGFTLLAVIYLIVFLAALIGISITEGLSTKYFRRRRRRGD